MYRVLQFVGRQSVRLANNDCKFVRRPTSDYRIEKW